MICDPCRDAGRWNYCANNDDPNPAGCQDEARRLHAKCEAPTTCPCQHRTGQHIKQEAK